MSRPTVLDDIVAQRIINAVRKGAGQRRAATLAGISRTTLINWLARGERGEEPYATFTHRYRTADAEHEEELVERIRAASLEHWTAAAWLLERKYAKRWARPEIRKPATEGYTGLSDTALDAEIANVRAALEPPKRKGARS